jgi:uncharacterized repeat protein (TIGR01451 family)
VTAPPGGGASAAATFTVGQYPVPQIMSVSPMSVPVNSPDMAISVYGSGFTVFSMVQVNGNTLSPSSWDPNDVFFILPGSYLTLVGKISITVSNPGALTSDPVTIDVTPNPVPSVQGFSPMSTNAGSPDFTLTVMGQNFVPTSVVQWNGSARPTTFGNSFQLTAAISATDVQALGNSTVTVFNPAPGGGLSTPVLFTTYLGLSANDLVYSPTTQRLYASVPSNAGATLGNSIVPIDPNTGTLGNPIFVGSEPGRMAISSDGGSLWVALVGAAAVRKVDLIGQTAGVQFSLGGGPGWYNPPANAQALAVMPGHSDTVAVAAPSGSAYTSQIQIFDSGVARTNAANGAVQCCSGVTGLAFDSTGTKLYEGGSGYGVAVVDTTGITSATSLNASVFTNALRVDNGQAYLSSGTVLNADTGIQVGIFSVGQNQTANGPVAPDSSVGEAFVLNNANFGSPTSINAYDISTFVLKGSMTFNGVPQTSQAPLSLVRWGQDGLAFTNGMQIYILRSPIVRDLSASVADLNVTGSVPATATTGTNLTYSLTVKNNGPVGATPATLTDNLPDGVTFQSVTSSQGNCSGGALVRCDLGNLNSGGSATGKSQSLRSHRAH